MAQKYLHELLQEDQEPFQLKNYIADKHSQMKTLQLKKRKPVSSASSKFPVNFCKNACFLSFTKSPDLRKSPLFEFKSPVRSPCKSPNNIFLHVPTRTAAVLLDAALRIQNNNNSGFGMFGSMLKKLKQKSKTQKSSKKDVLKWESFVSRKSFVGQKGENNAKSHSCELSNGSRLSSAAWSESNEETKSFDMQSSSSSTGTSLCEDEFEFVCKEQRDDLVFDCSEGAFCESPFRFVLQRSGRRTPELSSPAASPGPQCRRKDNDNFEDVKSLKKFPRGDEEEDEDKDQFSPVSVLDPPFQDYEDRQDGDYVDDDEGYGIQCSYENVQRAKQQLLHKLHRFEKLAGLDPIELEKRISEQEYDGYYDDETNDHEEEEEECDINKFNLSEQMSNGAEFVMEVVRTPNLFKQHYISKDMKRLISDLIAEEDQIKSGSTDSELTVKRVCLRLESWNEVKYNTIDMMVEQDLKRDHDWKNYQNHVGDVAQEVELAILGLLVEELSQELVQ